MSRPHLTFMNGFSPLIHAREGRMLGIRNPLDGPVFDTVEDAMVFTIGVMADHFDRGLGLSDASIERFRGMVT